MIVTNGYLSRYSSEDIGGLFYANLLTGEQRGDPVDGIVPTREIDKNLLGLVRSGTSIFGKQRNRCYLSIGKLGFANFSGVSGVDFLDDARAVATTDWDHDGDVDVIMTSRNGLSCAFFLTRPRNRTDSCISSWWERRLIEMPSARESNCFWPIEMRRW